MNPVGTKTLVEAASRGDSEYVLLIVAGVVIGVLVAVVGVLLKGWMKRIDGNISRIHQRFDSLLADHLPERYVTKSECAARHSNGLAKLEVRP